MSDSDDTDIMVEDSHFRTMRTFFNWERIKDILRRMADGAMNTSEIIQALSKFKDFSYQSRYSKKRISKSNEFDMLMQEYDEEIPQIFCKIATFVLRDTTFRYPLFKKMIKFEHTFRKEEVLYLLCSMVLQLIPKQQYHTQQKEREFSYHLNFSIVFQSSAYKTKAIIEYLKRELANELSFKERLTIKRHFVSRDVKDIIKQSSDKAMSEIVMKADNDSIENYYGQIKVDFANRFIGGGALSYGCVQEEIMFANHPELYISHLLCEAMEPNEAIFLAGFKKYNKNDGYSFSTKFAGTETVPYEYDENMRAKQYIVAIDALCFDPKSTSQFRIPMIQRQLLKAYCGFSCHDDAGLSIVSGNWGCGAFGGNVELKLLIQWMACSLANRRLIYCPFGSAQKLINQELFVQLKMMNVGKLYNFLQRACSKITKDLMELNKKYEEIKLFEILHQIIKASEAVIVVD